jgi:hypothetical protein
MVRRVSVEDLKVIQQSTRLSHQGAETETPFRFFDAVARHIPLIVRSGI